MERKLVVLGRLIPDAAKYKAERLQRRESTYHDSRGLKNTVSFGEEGLRAIVGRDLLVLLQNLGIEVSLIVKDPYNSDLQRATKGDANNWHRDDHGKVKYLVLWAWPVPTEFRDYVTKDKIPVRGGDVLLINNRLVEHRIPNYSGDRWSARGWGPKFKGMRSKGLEVFAKRKR